MKKIIVTTTINPPTEAIEKFDAMKDWTLVVVGDQKTPAGYKLQRGVYVSVAEQEKLDLQLSDAIGWNCIQRRSFGFIVAHQMGADIVATIDDDNIPLDGWGENLMVGQEAEVNYYETDLVAFDPIGATNHSAIWHRGFPLQLLPKRDYSKKSKKKIKVDVQADFWNGDPDIDAVCRMEHAPDCNFDPACFPIASNKLSPFNSQNTFVSSKLLPDYFMYPHVGRMDDIWAAYYVQGRGYNVAYGKASVRQDRNIHDLVRDMKQEYMGYENNLKLVEEVAADADALKSYLPGRSIRAWDLYRRHFR